MRLLKLSANMPSFRTVTFNRSGLSFVVGAQKSADHTPRNRTKTYNGVGKSLMIELIHFCLGSNPNDAFKKYLGSWTFELSVEVDRQPHVIRRNAGDQSELSLDGAKITLAKLREWLLARCFDVVPNVKGLTFRSLISTFLRAGRGAYERFDRAEEHDGLNPYYAMARNAFLLGLDLPLAQAKFDLRSRQASLAKTMKQLESDPLFASLFAEDKAGIELTSLREEAARLEANLRDFSVAEDYRGIQQEADAVKRELEAARRELVKVSDAIGQVGRSLASETDLDAAKVAQLYAEAEADLPTLIRKRIADVLAFQAELQRRRAFRLTGERQAFERRRAELQATVAELGPKLDAALRYLGSHVALDEYLAVNEQLNGVKQRVAKLEASNDQRERVNRELRTIARDLAEESLKADDYLAVARPLVEEANAIFRRNTKALYGTRPSGLTVSNDGGETLTRYRIDAHVNSDAAEGINEAKIFCYDLMVLALRRGHSVEFLVHDSSLFHPIDHRQRWAMLRLADAVCRQLDLQYVATLNEQDLTAIAPADPAEAGDAARILSAEAIVLRLTDQSPRERLLGIEVDMDYRRQGKPRDRQAGVDVGLGHGANGKPQPMEEVTA